MVSIIVWNMVGALHNPKNMTIGLNNPNRVMNTALCWSPSRILMLLYPALTSNLVKIPALPIWMVKLSGNGKGYAFLTVMSLRAQ